MEHESDGDTNCNWGAWHSHLRIGTGTRGLGNKRTIADHPNYRIIKIGENSVKSPGNLKRFAVTQTHVGKNPITVVGKTLKLLK